MQFKWNDRGMKWIKRGVEWELKAHSIIRIQKSFFSANKLVHIPPAKAVQVKSICIRSRWLHSVTTAFEMQTK